MPEESREERISRIRRERREAKKVAPTPVGYDLAVNVMSKSRLTFTGMHRDDIGRMLDMLFETGCTSVTLTPTTDVVDGPLSDEEFDG